MALSALAGLALLVLNGLSRSLYDHTGCDDPLAELTIAPIETDQSSYSCCWAVLAIIQSTTAAALTERHSENVCEVKRNVCDAMTDRQSAPARLRRIY